MKIHSKVTKEDIIEFVFLTYGNTKAGRKRDIKQRIVFSVIFAVCWLIFFLTPGVVVPVVWYIGMIASVLGFIAVFLPLVGRRSVEKQRLKGLEKFTGSTITIDDAGVRTCADDETQDIFFAWSVIHRVIISDNMYLFHAECGIIIFFNKEFVQGREPELAELIGHNVDESKVVCRKS